MHIQELKYPNNLYTYYQKLAHLPGFALLQSTDVSKGRYDILSAYPYDSIRISQSENNPLKLWQELTTELCQTNSQIDLPFQGGAIGYISYDFATHILGLDKVNINEPLVDLGLYDWGLIADHKLKKVFLFSDSKQKNTQEIIKEIISLWHGETPDLEQANLLCEFSPLLTKDYYYRCFDAIQSALRAGRCYQVNFTQPFEAEFKGDSWDLYQKISMKNPLPYAAFLRGTTDILSFSPERFLSYNEGQVISSPIKGTIGRSVNALEDKRLRAQLASCPKNHAENTMIVDLIRNDLGKIAKPGTVSVHNLCSIHSFKSVHHLISDVYAQCLDSIHPMQAFLSCFPGGSITGAPKLEAMCVIHELEPYNRGIYCGSIGYFSRHKRFDTNIAIRTISSHNGRLRMSAGGGIIIESEREEEYSECLTKIDAIVRAME